MNTQHEPVWQREGCLVYKLHKSERGTLENKFSYLVQPGTGVDQKEAEDLAENLRVISDLAEAHPHTHVDDFIDFSRDKSEAVIYARWFFQLHRLPAILKSSFRKQISEYLLFCDYEGKKYRVTGASRMGDIWLTDDFDQETGYKLRVLLTDCSNWSNRADGDYNEKH